MPVAPAGSSGLQALRAAKSCDLVTLSCWTRFCWGRCPWGCLHCWSGGRRSSLRHAHACTRCNAASPVAWLPPPAGLAAVVEPVTAPDVEGPPQAPTATSRASAPVVISAARRDRGRRLGPSEISRTMSCMTASGSACVLPRHRWARAFLAGIDRARSRPDGVPAGGVSSPVGRVALVPVGTPQRPRA